MTNFAIGKCSGCGVTSAGRTRDFLCEKCVNLDGGMIVCRLCHTRTPVTLERLAESAARGLPIPVQPGSVIVVTCEDCIRACRKKGVPFEAKMVSYTIPLH